MSATLVASCLAHAATPAPFSTFLLDRASILSLAHDSRGNIYALGVYAEGPYFVARLPPDASRFDYLTRLDATVNRATAFALSSSGSIYVAGMTLIGDKLYPLVLSLDAAGKPTRSLVLERAAAAELHALALDPNGAPVVTGWAYEPGFPSVGGGFSAPNSTYLAGSSIQPFTARVDAALTRIIATAVGVGGGHIALGPGGDVFVSGNTSSTEYPTTPGAFQTSFTPSFDCGGLCQLSFPSPEQYVSRLDASLATLRYSTYVTGTRGALHLGLAVDDAGTAYLTGTTRSPDYPYINSASTADRPGTFLTRLDPAGSKLLFSVRQGGELLGFDADGTLIAVGSLYPSTGLPYQRADYPPLPPTGNLPTACLPNGVRFQVSALLQRFDPATGSPLDTRILSATRAQPSALDVLPDGRILTAGYSVFPDIPLTPGPLFSPAIAQRTPYGVFLAAFDFAIPQNALACAVDGLTNMPLGPIAPGQLISIFGTFPGAAVTFDGIPATEIYSSPTQINLSVPIGLGERSTTLMQVRSGDRFVASRLFAVAPAVPSVFVDTGGSAADGNSFFPVVGLNPDGSKNSVDQPAGAGDWITLFVNGAAALTGSMVTAKLGTLTLESEPLAPWPGIAIPLNQVRVRLPATLSPGLHAVPLTLSIGDTDAGPFVYFDKVYQSGALIWTTAQ